MDWASVDGARPFPQESSDAASRSDEVPDASVIGLAAFSSFQRFDTVGRATGGGITSLKHDSVTHLENWSSLE